MNYLRITNNGLICAEDLTLIGSSTKRDQVGKIGMFGSGWKYALAWMLRNETNPRILSGNQEIQIDFTTKLHRDNPVNIITVNGIETSLTTQMGPKWTGWMALREIISNAIDEGGYSITTSWLPEIKGEEGKTVIYIPMNGELSDVMLKFDSYFAFYRKHSYENEFCKMFFKTEESNFNVYRKGIRCMDSLKRTKIDFDFFDIYISEDRLTHEHYVSSKVRDILNKGVPTPIFRRILQEETMTWLPEKMNDRVQQNLIDLINEGDTFTTPTLQKLAGLLFSNPDSLVIPAEWFKRLQDLGLVKSPFEYLEGSEEFIRTDARDVSGVLYNLSALNVKMEIRSGKCESDLFVSKGVCYIKDTTDVDDKTLAAKCIKRMSVEELTAIMN